MGAVLVQQGHPVAFASKTFSGRKRLLSAYERELMAIVFAVVCLSHWASFCHSHRPFTLKAPHRTTFDVARTAQVAQQALGPRI